MFWECKQKNRDRRSPRKGGIHSWSFDTTAAIFANNQSKITCNSGKKNKEIKKKHHLISLWPKLLIKWSNRLITFWGERSGFYLQDCYSFKTCHYKPFISSWGPCMSARGAPLCSWGRWFNRGFSQNLLLFRPLVISLDTSNPQPTYGAKLLSFPIIITSGSGHVHIGSK